MSKLQIIKELGYKLTDTIKFFFMGIYMIIVLSLGLFFLGYNRIGNPFIFVLLLSALFLLAIVYLAIILRKILKDITKPD